MKEETFRARVVKLARSLGWKTMFIGRSRGGSNWVTQMGGDGRGWPDLFLVRERPIAAELKTDVNYHVSPEERDWLAAMKLAGIETYLWRPRDWQQICDVLAEHDPERWTRLLSASGGDVMQAAMVDRLLKERT